MMELEIQGGKSGRHSRPNGVFLRYLASITMLIAVSITFSVINQQIRLLPLTATNEMIAEAAASSFAIEESSESSSSIGSNGGVIDSSRWSCDFLFTDFDPRCPRFVRMDFMNPKWAGLGDRFFQLLVALTFAIDTKAILVSPLEFMASSDTYHGNYTWITDFFRFDFSSNMNLETIEEQYHLKHVGIPNKAQYEDRLAELKAQSSDCNVMIDINMNSCVQDRLCYAADTPQTYERIRNIVACWFLHTDRTSLPSLVFDAESYNVVIHLRVGDITLLGGEEGVKFFTNIKQQLDVVLRSYRVHYYFLAEDPNAKDGPPQAFAFLADIFLSDGTAATSSKVFFLNDLDVRTSLYNQMNADMLIATGSSFPLVASTVSPKPIVLFSRPKEGVFHGIYRRHDYVVLNESGIITKPSSLSELQAHVRIRYLEVHEKFAPYYRF